MASSFGIIPLLSTLGRLAHHELDHNAHRTAYGVIALALLLAAALAGGFFRERLAAFAPVLEVQSFRGMLAASCATIYCFAFIGGASFNYRLIYLGGVLAFLLVRYDAGRKSALGGGQGRKRAFHRAER